MYRVLIMESRYILRLSGGFAAGFVLVEGVPADRRQIRFVRMT
jgi:hypothetical protein